MLIRARRSGNVRLMTRRNLPGARAAWPIVAAALVSCGPEPAPVIAPPRATASAASTAPAAEAVPPPEQAPFEPPLTCSADRYCWENPSPALGPLSAVWAAGERDIYAVGQGGQLLHFDGASWRLERSSMTGAFTSVWGSGPDDVYVGGAGEVLHRQGGVWKREVVDGRTALQALWGSGPGDVLAVGPEGASFHHDGRQWRARPTGTKADLRAVWGSGPKDVYAVGWDEKGGVLLHGNGASWEVLPRLGRSLVGVWGTGPDAVWVAGKDDRDELAVWRLAGAQWKQEKVPVGGEAMALSGAGGAPVLLGVRPLDENRGSLGPTALFTAQLAGGRWAGRDLLVTSPYPADVGWGLWGEAQGSAVVAGGWGVVGRVDSSGLQSLTGNVALGRNLTGVWGTSPTDVVAVGAEGALLRHDGKAWSLDPSGKGISFTAIHGAKDMLVASARGGKLLVRKNGAWTALASGTSKDLLAVWTNGDEIFAGGDEGTVVRCARGKCAPMKTKIEDPIHAIRGRSLTELYAVAMSAQLFRFAGTEWREVPGPGDPQVEVINPRARPRDIEEKVLHITAICPAPGGGLMVERTDGSYRVEGNTWTRLGDGGAVALTDGSDGEIRAVYGGSSAGTPTRVRRFDGESWHDEALPLSVFDASLLGIAGIWSGGGEVFLVGDAGAILHRRR